MVKKTQFESLLLLPQGYDLRYCLLTCLLLLRDRKELGPPPPQPPTAPEGARCGRKGYAWASPGLCLVQRGADRHHASPNPHGGYGTLVPRVPPGTRGDGGGSGDTRHHHHPHSGGYTRVPPALPGPGRDRDAPWRIAGTRHAPPPNSGSNTQVPPVLVGPRRDGDAPWGIVGTQRGSSPTQRRLHPSPANPAWAAEG